MIEHAYGSFWRLGDPVGLQDSRMFNSDRGRGWNIAGHMGSTPFWNEDWSGQTHAGEYRILDQIQIADLDSLALLSRYTPAMCDGTSVNDYWPAVWPQAFPTLLSSGPSPQPEPPFSFSRIESLAHLDFRNVENQTGENLVQLLDARAVLDEVAAAVGSCLDGWAVPSVFRADEGPLAGFELTTEGALGYFDIREPAPFFFGGNAVLRYVVLAEQIRETLICIQAKARTLLVKISYQIQSLNKAFFRFSNRYCGLSWARRAWFLLHGSHPPPIGRWQLASQSFGCARAPAS
jgi:hypothetical protein